MELPNNFLLFFLAEFSKFSDEQILLMFARRTLLFFFQVLYSLGVLGGRIGISTQGFALTKQAHTSSTFCSGYFGDGGFMNNVPGVAVNPHPPDLSFPS
jgi:hypothetical protein